MKLEKRLEESDKILKKYKKEVEILSVKLEENKVDMSSLRDCYCREKSEYDIS